MLQNLFQPGPLEDLVAPALLVVALFAGAAYAIRAVTTSGALAGAVLAFVIYISSGPGGFLVLFTVFLLTLISTRFRYARKQRLGTAEGARGRRAAQVIANLVVAGGLACASALRPDAPVLILGAVAALAEAAADTVSSEFGQAVSDHAYLITNFERVRAGRDGAISLPGTLAAVVAASIVTLVGFFCGVIPRSAVVLVCGAAVLGTFVDSLLGAWLEERGVIGNDAVNFASTFAAAGLAMLFSSARSF